MHCSRVSWQCLRRKTQIKKQTTELLWKFCILASFLSSDTLCYWSNYHSSFKYREPINIGIWKLENKKSYEKSFFYWANWNSQKRSKTLHKTSYEKENFKPCKSPFAQAQLRKKTHSWCSWYFLNYICGTDHANIELTKRYKQGTRFLWSVVDASSKNACVDMKRLLKPFKKRVERCFSNQTINE